MYGWGEYCSTYGPYSLPKAKKAKTVSILQTEIIVLKAKLILCKREIKELKEKNLSTIKKSKKKIETKVPEAPVERYIDLS